ncbi:MAG: aminoacyl-tRNA hydrolase [Desulfobacterales bacterium]
MPVKNSRLIVGLGNPGTPYENTRHNVGFMVVDDIADRFGIPLSKSKYNAQYGRGVIEGIDVLLAKPMDFMNNSGPPVQKLAHFFKIPAEQMIIIHDDIDLAYGRLKIVETGGHGGHNGVRSLAAAMGNAGFPRLRIGVGHPGSKDHVTDHVLGRFTSDEKSALDTVIARARQAIVVLLRSGIKEGMNLVNNRTHQLSE